MQNYNSNMESDYPDLYSQYSKIHSNNVDMDSNAENMHYQTNDMKPIEDRVDRQNDEREEAFSQIEMKNDIENDRNNDISRELAHCYDEDVSNSLAVNSQLTSIDTESKREEENTDEVVKSEEEQPKLAETKDSNETNQSEELPAQSSESTTEEKLENDKKSDIETSEEACKKETENKDVCRVCMNHGVLISIFDTDNLVTVCEKVMRCAAVQIAINDGLPGFICEPCISDLETAYNFKKRCEQSDVALRAKLGLKAKTIVKTEFVLIDCDNEPILSDDNKHYKSDSGADAYSEQDSDDPSYGSKKKKKKTKKKAKTKKAPKSKGPKSEKPKIEKLKIGKIKIEKVKPKPKERPERGLKRKAPSVTQVDSDDDVILVSKKQPPPKVKKTETVPPSKFPCTFCDKSFPYPSVLKLHLITHTKEKTHKCSICSMAFMYSKDLYSHYKDAHPNEYGKVDENGKYSCTICKKSFGQLKHLKNHEVLHIKEKKYKCELCPQTFKNMTSLNLHVKMDHPENTKPYKCKICDKRFKAQLSMEKHVENHKNTRPVEKIEEKRPTSTKDLFKSIAPLTTTYWSDSFSD